jgi:L-erythro-3,5-diaminohexanoate dehydrogenase
VTGSSTAETATDRKAGSPLGLHRVAEPVQGAGQASASGEARRAGGVLPQAAWRLDARPEIWPDEVRIRPERLNLDAASYRQLHEAHGGDADAIRSAVLGIIADRGKMQNPVTGSGGMLTGVVDEVGPQSPLGLHVGDRIATLVSLSLTPLAITDGLARWDGRSEQVPCDGHAILFGRSIATVLPADLPVPLSLAVMDVCGAPALTHRVVAARTSPLVAVVGAAGKSGSLSVAAARRAGADRVIGIVRDEREATALRDAGSASTGSPSTGSASTGSASTGSASTGSASTGSASTGSASTGSASTSTGGPGLADEVVVADARDPVGLSDAVWAAGGPADVTVVCVDVPGCEGGAILATAQGGTVIFFSMATSFSAAALGAEGVAADISMLIGNGYVPGHAEFALSLLRENHGVRTLFENRIAGEGEGS